MKRREILIMALLLVGSIITIFLPSTKAHQHIMSKKDILYALNQSGSRYISTDKVAQMIMENDPSIMLIDIRSPKEFNKFSIEGALNIPFDSIMTKDNVGIFDKETNPVTAVIYSNGSSKADQAWLKLHSFGYKGSKVMKGGLNRWYQTILNPQKPKDDELTSVLEKQYLFRKGAQIYFTGAQIIGSSAPKRKASSKPIVKRKKKEVSGGCG